MTIAPSTRASQSAIMRSGSDRSGSRRPRLVERVSAVAGVGRRDREGPVKRAQEHRSMPPATRWKLTALNLKPYLNRLLNNFQGKIALPSRFSLKQKILYFIKRCNGACCRRRSASLEGTASVIERCWDRPTDKTASPAIHHGRRGLIGLRPSCLPARFARLGDRAAGHKLRSSHAKAPLPDGPGACARPSSSGRATT